jgi:predicted amidohydrolase YtcJ
VPGDADLIFCNGTIFDGHEFLPAGTAVRVRAASIVAAEPDADARAAAGPGTEIVDLAGGTLLPGFIDAHMHPVFAGDQLRRCDLSGAVTLPEYLAIIRDYVDRNPGAGWVTGGGWSMEAFPGGIPTAAPLDEIAPDRPVYLPNRDGHGAWVNSKALQLAGINRDTLDPADGRIERGADGSPVGMLQEGAQNLVSRLLPELTEEDRDEALRLAQEHLLAAGITGWQDAIIGRSHKSGDPLPAYVRAADRGTLRATVVGALWWDRHRGLDQLAELIEERDLAPDGRFRATSVKMMLDGVAENHTAAMLEPYLDGHGCQTEVTGLDFIDPAELPRFVTAVDQAGFQVHFHALGDRAVRNALDAIQAARQANRGGSDGTGQRHHLAHLQVVHPDDVARFAQLGATANIQALWAAHEPQMDELTIPFLGERRSAWQYPFRSLHDSGAALCGGSDWPVSSPNPLWAAHVAVNRAVPDGPGRGSEDPFLPEQRLDLTTFLSAYTSGSARINGRDNQAGAVRAGLDADFAVVDADLSRIDSHDIGQAAVTQTWIRGEQAWHSRRTA